MKSATPVVLVAFSLVLSFSACGKEGPGEGSQGPVDAAAGAAFYKQTCVPCHGETGHGDGSASASLDPKPRNLSDKAWQASVDDAYLRKVTQYGGLAVGKSAAMPANPALGGKRAVLNGLVLYLRNLAK